MSFGAYTGEGAAAQITVEAPSDSLDCGLPTTPEELELVTKKLILDDESRFSTAFVENMQDAEEQIELATEA